LIKLEQPIIVEGKYDKITLENIVDALIIPTDGFGIFKNKEKCEMLRTLARKNGIIVMTDSDSAGFKIRSFIKGITKCENVKNVYIPDVYGKEKRKTEFSKEGKLGVEGMKAQVIIDGLKKAGVICDENDKEASREITHTDFFEDGISGGENSSRTRKALARELELPERISSSSLLKIINSYMTYEEYKNIIEKINNN
jgi:ribonuclease M5